VARSVPVHELHKVVIQKETNISPAAIQKGQDGDLGVGGLFGY
jgi:hypothetical protein